MWSLINLWTAHSLQNWNALSEIIKSEKLLTTKAFCVWYKFIWGQDLTHEVLCRDSNVFVDYGRAFPDDTSRLAWYMAYAQYYFSKMWGNLKHIWAPRVWDNNYRLMLLHHIIVIGELSGKSCDKVLWFLYLCRVILIC